MSEDAAPSGAVHLVDRGDTVDVILGVPAGTSQHDLSVRGGADALQVAVARQQQPLLKVLQLYSTVDPERSRTRIEDGRAVITLHKRDPALAWPGLHAVCEEPESQQVKTPLMSRSMVTWLHASGDSARVQWRRQRD